MPTDQNPKQLIAQRIKDVTNILVTVSHDPSVDELSAALAMTLMLDKMGKAATAVFSGKIPPAIDFLEPGKTFDTNVDALRDFIIALDKTKADRLRYKVEDDVVRVFITPYKTTITEKDLTFSQGDFNVQLILAFGVEKHDDLDTAITAHGRILHDASVVTVNLNGTSSLGEVDWNDMGASSLCEMLMSLSEALQPGLLDEPIATALLTGIVSATDRFRNEKTSPKVMTMAAQLMAAGANQQLIAEKLEESTVLNVSNLQGTNVTETAKSDAGEMKVEHNAPLDAGSAVDDALETKEKEVAAEESADAMAEVQEQLAEIAPAPQPAQDTMAEPETHAKSASWRDTVTPSMGGTLNATSEQAHEDTLKEEAEDKNHILLSHDSPASSTSVTQNVAPVMNATGLSEDSEPTVPDLFAGTPAIPSPSVQAPSSSSPMIGGSSGLQFEETPLFTPPSTPQNQTLADLEKEVHQKEQQDLETNPVDNARAAVDAAFGSQPFDPAGQALSATGAQPLGSVTHDNQPVSTPPVITPAFSSLPPAPAMPPLPPLPDFSTLPPLPGEAPIEPTMTPTFGLPDQPNDAPLGIPTIQPSSDPGQFKLPGS